MFALWQLGLDWSAGQSGHGWMDGWKDAYYTHHVLYSSCRCADSSARQNTVRLWELHWTYCWCILPNGFCAVQSLLNGSAAVALWRLLVFYQWSKWGEPLMPVRPRQHRSRDLIKLTDRQTRRLAQIDFANLFVSSVCLGLGWAELLVRRPGCDQPRPRLMMSNSARYLRFEKIWVLFIGAV